MLGAHDRPRWQHTGTGRNATRRRHGNTTRTPVHGQTDGPAGDRWRHLRLRLLLRLLPRGCLLHRQARSTVAHQRLRSHLGERHRHVEVLALQGLVVRQPLVARLEFIQNY